MRLATCPIQARDIFDRTASEFDCVVEQHKDDVDRQIYILSTKPYPAKATDKGKPGTANKIDNNEAPGIEVVKNMD